MSRKYTVSIPQTAPSVTPTTVTSTTSGDHQSLPILSTGHTVQTSTVSETATSLTQSTSSYLTPSQSMAAARPLSGTSVATASQARQSPTVDLTSATGTTRIVTCSSKTSPAPSIQTTRSASGQSTSSPEDVFAILSFEAETDALIWSLSGENSNDACRQTIASSSGLYTPPPQASPALALLPHSSQTVLPLSSPEEQDSPLAALSNLLDNVIEVSETSSSSAEQSSTVTQTVDIDTDIDSVTRNTQGALHQALPVNSSALRQSVSPPEDEFPALSLEVEIETEHSTKPLPDENSNDARRETTAMSSGLYTRPPQASPTMESLIRISRAVSPLASSTNQGSPLAALSSVSGAIPRLTSTSNSSQAEQSSITDQTVDIQETRARVHSERDKMWVQVNEESSPALSLMGSSSENSSESLPTGGAIGISLEDSLASDLFGAINEPGHVDMPAESFAMGGQDDVPHTERHASPSLSPSATSDDHNQASPPETVTQPSPPCEDPADKTSARSADASPPSLRQDRDSESPIQWPTYVKGTTPPAPSTTVPTTHETSARSADASPPSLRQDRDSESPIQFPGYAKGLTPTESSTTVPTTHETRDASISLTEEQSASQPLSDTIDISESDTGRQDIVALAMKAAEIRPSPDRTSHDQSMTPAHAKTQTVPTTKKRSSKRDTIKKKQRFGFPCKICTVIFTSFDTLELHYKIKHASYNRFLCEICGKSFKQSSTLRVHLKTHSEERAFKCNICDKGFTLKRYLKEHKKTHSEERAFKCNFCGKGFKWRSTLISHLTTHSEERAFKCKICDKGFTLKRYLKEHKKTHSEERAFKCNFCGKGFKWRSTLISHLTTHSEERAFKCKICGKGFTLKRYLKEHKKTHSEERAFKCNFCDKGFKQPSDLKSHLKTHSEERAFKCNFCDKGFKQPSDLKSHLKTHSQERAFKCDICSKVFRYENSLKRHMKTHSEERAFTCHICGKGFKWRSNLKDHLKIHSEERAFKCKLCDKAFNLNQHLKNHMKTHQNQRTFKCVFCGKAFNFKGILDQHMAIHNEGSPFNCDICNMAFKTKSRLTHHMKTQKHKALFHQYATPVSASQATVTTTQAQSTASSDRQLMPNPALVVSDQSNRLLPAIEEPGNDAPDDIYVDASNLIIPLSPPRQDTP